MADFTKPTVADMVVGNADINIGTNGSMQVVDWGPEDDHWRKHHAAQPWATADRSYEFYQPAYKYGHHAASTYRRPWDDAIESDLEKGWTNARADSPAEWGHVRDAVHAAYSRSSNR